MSSKFIYKMDECPVNFIPGDTVFFRPDICISVETFFTFTEKHCKELTELIYNYLSEHVKGKKQ